MSLQDHVQLTITQDSVGIARAGFGIPMILSVNASFPERIRFYTTLAEVGEDFATTSPEYLAANAMFAQSPHPTSVAIGRAVGAPTMIYEVGVTTVAEGSTYTISVEGEGVTAGEATYTALADIVFTADNTSETFTSVAHGMETGDGPFRVSNAGGALPSGLSADTNYWVISLTDDTFQLATSKADALSETELLITTDGTGTQTLRRAQNDVICAQLVQGLNAITGKNYTAAQTAGAGETDYITVTGTNAGDWFSLSVSSVALMNIEMTHAEPGTTLATDLAAISLENDTWYALYTLYNSDAYVKAAAQYIEAQKKIYIADLVASETATLATGGGDTADDLEDLNYARTAVFYHPDPSAMAGAAWLGLLLPTEPGSATWKFKTLAGVAAVTTTATHRVNLRAKSANTMQTIAGRNITWEGTTTDGDFVDITRDLDWLEDDMVKGVFGVLAGAAKIPFTNAGIAIIEKEIYASLDRAFRRGIIADDYTVTVPRVSDVSTSDKALRLLTDVKFTCTMQGAIHKVTINGVVSV